MSIEQGREVLVDDRIRQSQEPREVRFSDVAKLVNEGVAHLVALGAIRADHDSIKYIEERTLRWATQQFFPDADPTVTQELRGTMNGFDYSQILATATDIARIHRWDVVDDDGPTQADALAAYDEFSPIAANHHTGSDLPVDSEQYWQARRAFEDIMLRLPDDDRREVWKIINERFKSTVN